MAKAPSKAPTKTQILANIAEETELSKKDVAAVFDSLSREIAKALDITTKRTGLLVGLRPDAAMLAKFKSGELSGFSIGGERIEDEAA